MLYTRELVVVRQSVGEKKSINQFNWLVDGRYTNRRIRIADDDPQLTPPFLHLSLSLVPLHPVLLLLFPFVNSILHVVQPPIVPIPVLVVLVFVIHHLLVRPFSF